MNEQALINIFFMQVLKRGKRLKKKKVVLWSINYRTEIKSFSEEGLAVEKKSQKNTKIYLTLLYFRNVETNTLKLIIYLFF